MYLDFQEGFTQLTYGGSRKIKYVTQSVKLDIGH